MSRARVKEGEESASVGSCGVHVRLLAGGVVRRDIYLLGVSVQEVLDNAAWLAGLINDALPIYDIEVVDEATGEVQYRLAATTRIVESTEHEPGGF